jgi:hypothetical protein
MRLFLKQLKRPLLIIKVLLIGYSLSGQNYTWGDTTSVVNYTVISILEAKPNQLFVLGRISDGDFKNPKIIFSKVTLSGQVFTKICSEPANLSDLNSMLFQPDGMLRVYGTSLMQNGLSSVNMTLINPANNTVQKSVTEPNPSQHSGDVKPINQKELIQTKSIKNSTTGVFNIFASRMLMQVPDIEKKKILLQSKFNEFPVTFSILPDSSFYILAKRYTDQGMTKPMGVIYSIKPDFTSVWNMEILNSAGLSNQYMTCAKDGWIYYFCSMKESNGLSSSKGYIFDKNGTKLRQISIDSFYVSCVLMLKNGNVLITGYKNLMVKTSGTERASYILFDRTLKKLKSKTPLQTDLNSSSEYNTAIQTANGKIVLGGRVFQPVNANQGQNKLQNKPNKFLISVLNENGE